MMTWPKNFLGPYAVDASRFVERPTSQVGVGSLHRR